MKNGYYWVRDGGDRLTIVRVQNNWAEFIGSLVDEDTEKKWWKTHYTVVGEIDEPSN